jgi:hypothetical protein
MPLTLLNTNGTGNFSLINNNNSGKFSLTKPYSQNLIVQCGGNPDVNAATYGVSIGGGPEYIILEGTFPVYANPADGNTVLYGHHFGGTSVSVSEFPVVTIYVYKNEVQQGISDCLNPNFGPFVFNFTENDIIRISGDYCGG